ncbi:conserved hypothetical protein [Candidatus Caldarchaeum subterraneum]|uniref:DUF998 domain-containing protein n=1 Tax=Caldiarchaeum subterraneum TaxID=311458 RepID=E6N9E6_CALS0|nr:conserved hypothetical protein [Candidatus Caldarchaeum subterraneum]BAJ49776.1 conserved hypothetical protein [Candidatus Caldarchaeum subterraneum]BAJ51536.1 conserved hypothetical protein [Candidatus Caldarchaeum subterraneum]
MRRSSLAGAVLFIGVAQFLFFLRVAESIYPGYSVSGNYISDLGVGVAAPVFNTSVSFLGVCVIAAAYLSLAVVGSRVFAALVAAAGVGAFGVGLFPENVPVLHTVFSFITFFFAGLAAVYGLRVFNRLMGVFSMVCGLTALAALALFASGNYLGLGHGGMERLIVYPVLSWGLLLSGYFIAKAS